MTKPAPVPKFKVGDKVILVSVYYGENREWTGIPIDQKGKTFVVQSITANNSFELWSEEAPSACAWWIDIKWPIDRLLKHAEPEPEPIKPSGERVFSFED